MKKLFQKLKEIWSIKELRNRILFTLALLSVYRLGSHIALPGINAAEIEKAAQSGSQSGILGLINTFSGGSFFGATLFALGIMPYISASIFVQLLTFAVPAFQKMQREGESGQRKINQMTRLLAVLITFVQASAYLTYVANSQLRGAISGNISWAMFNVGNVILITAGTIFCMWLGERITDRGVGNGTSLIIGIGIMSRFPASIAQEIDARFAGTGGFIIFIVEIVFLILVTIATILLIQAVRKIPLTYARAMTSRGQRNVPGANAREYLPIKLNTAGVMPIIFAQALMFLPAAFATSGAQSTGFLGALSDPKSFAYNAIYFVLILVFTYVYTALVVNPQQMAENLKRNNSFIPGVKPGRDTADFIDTVATRVTLPGGFSLALIAVLPTIVMSLTGAQQQFAYFYGGTSLIIMVGVVLDTLQVIESHLLMRQYDGLIKGSRITGRQSSFALTQ